VLQVVLVGPLLTATASLASILAHQAKATMAGDPFSSAGSECPALQGLQYVHMIFQSCQLSCRHAVSIWHVQAGCSPSSQLRIRHQFRNVTAVLAHPAWPHGCLSFPIKAVSEGRSSNHTCEGELVLPPACEVLVDHPIHKQA
jgi:hypothetical protein